jgi:hypothetical protein
MTAARTSSPSRLVTLARKDFRTSAESISGVIGVPASVLTGSILPMRCLNSTQVFAGSDSLRSRAVRPTCRFPRRSAQTADGVVSSLSLFLTTSVPTPRSTAIALLVVPRSIPKSMVVRLIRVPPAFRSPARARGCRR